MTRSMDGNVVFRAVVETTVLNPDGSSTTTMAQYGPYDTQRSASAARNAEERYWNRKVKDAVERLNGYDYNKYHWDTGLREKDARLVNLTTKTFKVQKTTGDWIDV